MIQARACPQTARRNLNLLRRAGALAPLAAALFAATSSASCIRGSCDEIPLATVNYDDASSWICRPGRDDACSQARTIHDVKPDGSVEKHDESLAADRSIDCFYIYPTMDLRLVAGVHDNLDDREEPLNAVRTQAARFGEVCSVYAPMYRQVTLGTYAGKDEQRKPCFDVAFSDARAAFEHYLKNDNKGRGFVLLGHSQGGQVVSRLIREVVEKDPEILARMIVAMPIGWPVATAAGKTTGGSFTSVPVCTGKDQLGCTMGYGSFGAENDFPTTQGDFIEGDERICTNPASPDDAAAKARLIDSTFRGDVNLKNRPEGVPDEKTSWVRYADAYEARCVADDSGARYLEVSWSPKAGDARKEAVDLSALLYSGATGAHVLDISWAQADLVADVSRRGAIWLAGGTKP